MMDLVEPFYVVGRYFLCCHPRRRQLSLLHRQPVRWIYLFVRPCLTDGVQALASTGLPEWVSD